MKPTQCREHIEKYYKVPCKRGQVVRLAALGKHPPSTSGKVVWWNSSYLVVRLDNGKKITTHPYNLDYLIDREWQLGATFKAAHDAAWDQFNAQLNATYQAERKQING